LLSCIHYVSASQNLKDFLGEIYDKAPTVIGNDVTWEKLYDHFYSKTEGHETVWEDILTISSFGITHRIYLAVKREALVRVYDRLKPALRLIAGFKMAKRCRPEDAVSRPDTIVIYVGSAAARDAVVEHIRMSLRDSHWNQPFNRNQLTLAARLNLSDFKPDVPPGTGRIADLTGVAVADDPGPGQSFGIKLCKATEVALKNKGYQQDRLLFIGYALGCLSGEGFNIRAPWRAA
jgi:hypothetical protein